MIPADDTAPPANPMPESPIHRSAWSTALATGWEATKRNRVPAIVMWMFGICLILGFFYVPPVRETLQAIGRFKVSWGWKFSIISTGIFGGLIPSMIPRLLGQTGRNATLGFVVASTILWAYKGFEIDMFYQLQAWLFGTNLDFKTIAIKTICDQFIMVPILGITNVVLFYRWRDCGYSFTRLFSTLERGWYQRLVLPVMIANWMVWVPAVAMIYSLPVALQLPIQNLILCFWVLILVFFTSSEQEPADDHLTPISASK